MVGVPCKLQALRKVGTRLRHLVRLSLSARAGVICSLTGEGYFSSYYALERDKNDLRVLPNASRSWECAAFQDP